VGVLLFCALAAQQQGAQADEAVGDQTNYAPVTHIDTSIPIGQKNARLSSEIPRDVIGLA
jgi:hypothetical protein